MNPDSLSIFTNILKDVSELDSDDIDIVEFFDFLKEIDTVNDLIQEIEATINI